MRQRFANNITTQLAAEVSPSDQYIRLKAGDGSLFPALAASEHIRVSIASGIDHIEIVDCTAINDDTLVVSRAQEGTTALSFPAGATVYIAYTAQSAQHVHDAVDSLQEQMDGKVNLSGGTMSGRLVSDGQLPASPEEFASKHYVDMAVSGATSNVLSSYITVVGWIAPFTGNARWHPPFNVNITACQCYQGTAPTVTPTVIDLLKNGTESIFGDTKPTIAVDGHTSDLVPSATRIDTTDYLVLKVIGGTGADLTIRFHYIPTGD